MSDATAGVERARGVLRSHQGVRVPTAQGSNHGPRGHRSTPLLRLGRGARRDLEPWHALPPTGKDSDLA